MRCKGQAELIIIVALMVVIAVVVVSQLNLFVLPGESPDVRTVRESAEGLIRTAVLDTMETMSDNGGYLSADDYQLGSVSLNGKDVPYWQLRGQVTYPDMASNLQAGVQSYLDENKDSLSEALTDVVFGDPVVNVPTVTDGSVTVSVNMPTTFKDAQIPQPYTVEVNTHFGEIYGFAKGFAAYEANERPFEYFTLSSMVMSPMEDGHHSIPINEILVGCGDYLYASSYDVIPEMEKTIVKTLAYTYMPGKVPLGTMNSTGSPKYSLVPINGRDYDDLDVSFMLPDDFALSYSSFSMSPDPAMGMAQPIPMMAECMSQEPVSVSYTVDYPVIVRAADPETGNIFQYAIDVFIDGNKPASWSVQSPEEGICQERNCLLELAVQDISGNPIDGAEVSFMGCGLGKTYSGFLTATAPCGSGTLSVNKKGYGEFLQSRTSSQLSGTVTLRKIPQLNVIFNVVNTQDLGSGRYMVLYGDIQPLNDRRVYLSFLSASTGQEYDFYSGDASLSIRNVPAGNYYVYASLASPDFMVIQGGMAYVTSISDDQENLYIYIPTTYGFTSLSTDQERITEAAYLSSALEACGIGPVTDTPYTQEEACSVTIA